VNETTIAILLAVALQISLGLVVFYANRGRRSNQGFLILSLAATAWLMTLFFAFTATTEGEATWAIREAYTAGMLVLAALNLLRLAMKQQERSWRDILYEARYWIFWTAVAVAITQTKWFVSGAHLSDPLSNSIPKAVYDLSGMVAYGAISVAAAITLMVNSVRDLRGASGEKHAELAFVMIGGLLVVIIPVVITLALQLVIDTRFILPFAPLRVVLFTAVVAYGVATRKLMEVGLLLRRVISYSLLTLYLLVLYAVVWWLVATVLHSIRDAHSVAHVTAGIVIAFAMAPARGVSRQLAERLFISTHGLDFRGTVSKATEILSSITTLHDLLQRFGGTIAEAVGAERVLILLEGRGAFTTRFSLVQTAERIPSTFDLPVDGPIPAYLKTHREPVVLQELYRIRRTAEIARLTEQMQELNAAVAMGIFSREHLTGVMLLGPRASGRIYGSAEQNALSVLCGQLAVAIDNAQLFTEVQNARIYNETLLQNLTTGVIATNVDERITVFNNEAGQIMQVEPFEILDQPVQKLPGPVRSALRETIATGEGQNAEFTLETKGEGITVRISTSVFYGQDNRVLGALMVLTDVTALKRLELQIRRSDRLASLGTLSAGMAHEIKNPLVSIKTFAQLLPERYEDSDFRETFSNLIGHEIDRIDSLVNQLLRFARPAKPHLQPSHVHAILEKSLLLVGHRLYQKDIKLTRFWEANVDTIRADADQLEQVFLNFFINAMDAMKNGGELSVATEVLTDEEWLSHLAGGHNGDTHEVLRVTIRDNGEGIRSEDLAHVFDPFFTTKDYGTGLGLSVVHGIIQEHGGQIEVESELHKGTAFHILLPLVRFDSEVVAA
jgi:nitrogen-specific signal transduction histidine kinase